MGFVEFTSLVLFVALLYRLRDQHLAAKSRDTTAKPSDGGKVIEKQGEEDKEQGLEAFLTGMAKESDPGTLALFVLLAVSMLFPVLTTGSSASASSKDDDASSSLTTASPSSRFFVAPLSHHWESNVVTFLGQSSDKDILIGFLDLEKSKSTSQQIGELTSRFLETALELQSGRLVAIAVATKSSGGDMYGGHNLFVDMAVKSVNAPSSTPKVISLHTFVDTPPLDAIFERVEECVQSTTCESLILRDSSMLQTYVAVKQALEQFVQEENGGACLENTAATIHQASEGDRTSLHANKVENAGRRQQVREEVGAGDDDDDDYDFTIFRLFFFWITRLLGFVYPIHETYHSLLSKNPKLSEWRAYWTIYSFVHFVEDVVFIRIWYVLVPFYLIGKMIFLGWCMFPDPTHSLDAYNMLLDALRVVRVNHAGTLQDVDNK